MSALRTPLCDLLGVDYPVVQAPIGSATCPELAAAVSNAGGLGTLAVTWRDFDETRQVIEDTRELTDAPFGVNLVLDDATTVHDTADHLEACLDAGAEITSFSFGDASPYVERIHEAGGIVVETVGSASEATDAEAAGVDVVVAQGWEAGGHVQSEVASMPLVPAVADAVDDTPVIAAGGIGDGRGVVAALALGAAGAWLGTRFLTACEANVHEEYRRKVVAAEESDTQFTELYDKGWPARPHRIVENSTVERWEAVGRPPPGDRPGESDVVARNADGHPIERYDEALATQNVSGDVESMALFAGQSAGLAGTSQPVAEILSTVVEEADATIDRLSEGLD